MKYTLSLLKKKESELDKYSPAAQQLSKELYRSFARIIERHCALKKKTSYDIYSNFLIRIKCDSIDIAVEAETAYALALKIRKAKTYKEKKALYEPYRKKHIQVLKFGELAVKIGNIFGVDDLKYVMPCDSAVIKSLKKHFPYLNRVMENQIPVFGSFYWLRFMQMGVDAAKLTGMKMIYRLPAVKRIKNSSDSMIKIGKRTLIIEGIKP